MDNTQGKKFQVINKTNDLYKEDLFRDKEFSDVTIVTSDESHVDAHKIILSSHSSFFKRILRIKTKGDIIIYLPNISYVHLQSFLEYIYLGHTEIEGLNLEKFLNVGRQLGLQGFDEVGMKAEMFGESTIDKISEYGYEGEFVNINKPILKRQSNGKFACDRCKFESVRRGDIKRHKDAVHLGLKYKCNECTNEYGAEDQVKAHIESVHKGNFNHCHLCDKKFEQPRVLKQHIRISHEGAISKCKECDGTFNNGSALTHHVQKEHRDDTYQCEHCNYNSKFSKNLKLHIKTKH